MDCEFRRLGHLFECCRRKFPYGDCHKHLWWRKILLENVFRHKTTHKNQKSTLTSSEVLKDEAAAAEVGKWTWLLLAGMRIYARLPSFVSSSSLWGTGSLLENVSLCTPSLFHIRRALLNISKYFSFSVGSQTRMDDDDIGKTNKLFSKCCCYRQRLFFPSASRVKRRKWK